MTTFSPKDFFKTQDGAYLYYHVEGDGFPIILLHGWSSSSVIFHKNIIELRKRYKTITFDYRGHGSSSKVLTGHTCDQYAGDLHQLLEYLDIQQFVLVGWSMGVTIALEYIRNFGSDSVEGLVLIDGSCRPFETANWNRGNLQGYDMNALMHKLNNRAKKYYTVLLSENQETYLQNPEFFDSPFAREIMKTPIWISYAIYNDYMMQDNTEVLQKFSKPLMVMVPVKNLERGKYEAGFASNSELCVFDTNHALFYEDPQNFNRYLTKFVDKIIPNKACNNHLHK